MSRVVLSISSLRTRVRFKNLVLTNTIALQMRTTISLGISTKGICSTWNLNYLSAGITAQTYPRAQFAKIPKLQMITLEMKPSLSLSSTKCSSLKTINTRLMPISMISCSLNQIPQCLDVQTFLFPGNHTNQKIHWCNLDRRQKMSTSKLIISKAMMIYTQRKMGTLSLYI